MGILQEIKNIPSTVRNLNKLADLIAGDKNASSYLPRTDFFDTTTPGMLSTALKAQGLTDTEVSPRDIYDMIHKDTYFTSLFEQLEEALFKNGFYIQVEKDADGNLLGSEKIAKYYEDQLKRINYEKLVSQIVYGERADGGGNVLLFTVKTEKGFQFKVVPFLKDGYARVRVEGDRDRETIHKYQVINKAGEIIYTIDPQKNYYKHVRYSEGGNFMFSNNPAKRAVYWYILKKFIAGSNLAEFKNGFQEPVLASPDYAALTHLVNAMGANSGQVSGKAKKEYLQDPIKFLTKQSILDDEILREITGDPRRSNLMVKLKMPYTFQKVGRNNQSMRVIEMINLCDIQMGYALRTSKGVLNTMDSKYANAEVEKDNWNNFVLDPLKNKIESITEEFFLPALDSSFDPSIYKVRFGRDADAEDVEIFNAQTARLQTKANVLTQIGQIPGARIPEFKYNFYTNDIEPVDEEDVGESEENVVVEETDTNRELERFYLYEYEDLTREASEERIERAYKSYHDSINMSRSELEKWSDTECSKKASLDRSPIRRNLELLDTPKRDWTTKHASWALKTVGFIARMKKNLGGENIVKTKDGKECGTKAHISLKNWAYDSTKRGKASSYKTGVKRVKKKVKYLTLSERLLKSKDVSKFEKIILRAFKKQLEDYKNKLSKRDSIEDARANLDKDLKPLSHYGINVSVYKDQLAKFADMACQSFIEEVAGREKDVAIKKRGINDPYEMPASLKELMDIKAQLIIKGSDSLNTEQKQRIETVFGRDLVNYKGLDNETTALIDSVLKDTLESGIGMQEIKNDLISIFRTEDQQKIINELEALKRKIKEKGITKYDALIELKDLQPNLQGLDPKIEKKFNEIEEIVVDQSKNKNDVVQAINNYQKQVEKIAITRTNTIVNTEPAQMLEGSRYELYTESGYNEKRWRTAQDARVRPAHEENARQGYIAIDSDFANGARHPGEEVNCRCSLSYRIAEPKRYTNKVPVSNQLDNITKNLSKEDGKVALENLLKTLDPTDPYYGSVKTVATMYGVNV